MNTRIEKGEVRGLLGANGSGKSTLMKILLGLVRPENGQVTVEGINPAIDPIPVRQIVGYVPETPRLYDFLSGIEYLDFVADLHGLSLETKKERIDEYLSAFDLKEQGNDLISGYSLGMKQKIAISAAMIHKPKVLILDEALNGLDPRAAKIVKDTITKLASDGVTGTFQHSRLGNCRSDMPENNDTRQGGDPCGGKHERASRAGWSWWWTRKYFPQPYRFFRCQSNRRGTYRLISFRKVWVIAKSLLLSQLRAAASRSGRVFNVRSIIRRPLILAIIDLVGFVLATTVAYYIGSSIESSGSPQLVSLVTSGVRSILVILPAVILTIILVLGLVLEVSAGAQFASSDTVNWLPVRAIEYVAASTLSLLDLLFRFPDRRS